MSRKKKVTRGNPAKQKSQVVRTIKSSPSSNWQPSESIVPSYVNMKTSSHRRQKINWKKITVLMVIIGMAISLFATLLISAPSFQEPISPYNAPDVTQTE